MANVSTDVELKTHEVGESLQNQVATTIVLPVNALTSQGCPDHGTTATKGRLIQFTAPTAAGAAAPGEMLVGRAANGWPLSSAVVTGDTAAKPIPEMRVAIETEHREATVTGLAGTVADQGTPVWATFNNTFTLTAQAAGYPVGIVEKFISSTKAVVRFFGYDVLRSFEMAAMGRRTMLLGSWEASLVADGNIATGIVLPGKGKITGFYMEIKKTLTATTATSALNLEIDGTNVTGGIITPVVSGAFAYGLKAASTAITAANLFHDGSLLDIEASATTTFTAGTFELWINIDPVFGF